MRVLADDAQFDLRLDRTYPIQRKSGRRSENRIRNHPRFLSLVGTSCQQFFRLLHIGPLRALRSTCQRFHVHSAHCVLAFGHGSNKTPSLLSFTGRAVFVIPPASSRPHKSPRHSTTFSSNRDSTVYAIITVFVDPHEAQSA